MGRFARLGLGLGGYIDSGSEGSPATGIKSVVNSYLEPEINITYSDYSGFGHTSCDKCFSLRICREFSLAINPPELDLHLG